MANPFLVSPVKVRFPLTEDGCRNLPAGSLGAIVALVFKQVGGRLWEVRIHRDEFAVTLIVERGTTLREVEEQMGVLQAQVAAFREQLAAASARSPAGRAEEHSDEKARA